MKRKPYQSLAVLLIGLALVTTYSLFRQKPGYELAIIHTPNGWGYQIVHNGTTVIDQPTVPGLAGKHGFETEELARKVGERVVSKLRRGEFPPTLTAPELSQLGVPVR
ncbi:hypothetical protein GCM10028803_03350 [Larkinella knui]|uniref:DUF4907 domain-containing protein n=1 Tax=Larkinella knui TaxID=2025310 RepID=A0A3P1CKX0_9BACT|nr:DUF4907 domain-containing protein [Larkinella knui]RRB13973.1 DUF4907 domain-containing protein [Larkinella knui]